MADAAESIVTETPDVPATPVEPAATPAVAPEIKDTTNLATGDAPADDKPVVAEWPEDWREKYAGTDESKMNVLKRYASPQAALDALFAARNKIQTGTVKTPLSDNPTPEELSAFRKENGIPEKPEEYDTNIEGLVFGEDDKPVIEGFLQKMHAANASPAQVKAGLEAYHAAQEQIQEARYEQDTQFKQASLDQIKSEWGQDYKLNINLMKGMFEAHGDSEVMDLLFGGRAADGNVIGNHPAILRALVAVAREVNPVATVTGTGNISSIDDEMAALQKMMGDTKSEYWKGPTAEKNQARYRQLLEAKSKLK